MAKTRPKTPKTAPDENGLPKYIHVEKLSAIVGIAQRRLNQLITDSRISAEVRKGAPEGHWNTSKAFTEIFGYYRRQADKSKPTYDLEIERKMKLAELRKVEIHNAKTSGNLLPIGIMAQIWGESLSIFKNRFLGFGDKMGPVAFDAKDKVEAGAALESEVRDIFAGLPAEIEGLADRITGEEFDGDGDPARNHPGNQKPAGLGKEGA